MAPWRARARRMIFRRQFASVVAESPLETGLIGWSTFAVVNLATGTTTSRSLTSLPGPLEKLWAILMALAALTVLVGLIARRFATVATGMYLFGTILSAYAVAVVGASGWRSGGAISGLLVTFGLVCFLRGWWLKDAQSVLVREVTRQHDEES